MSVYLEALKAERVKLLHNVAQAHNLIVASIDLKAVVVQHKGQVVQLVMSGRHRCLPNQALLALAVAQYRVNMILRSGMLRGQSQAHSQGSALS